MTMRHRFSPLLFTVAATAFFAGLVAGVLLMGPRQEVAAGPKDAVYEKLSLFAKVLSYVENNYVDPVPGEALVYGALRGMLSTLDPHSVFLPPDVFKELKIDTTGEFQGLGLIIDHRGEGEDAAFLVQTVLPDSPARNVGIKSGDVLLKVDEEPVMGLSLQEVVRLLRGPVGTTVTLSIASAEDGIQKDYVLVRARVKLSSVDSAVYPPFGYLHIKAFQNQTSREVRKAVTAWLSQNPPQVKGIIIDLRDNPGGLLDEAVAVADIFMEQGLIVSVEGRNRHAAERSMARKDASFPGVPLAVLVNGGSASASEVLSGAFQDSKRAIIVGERTYGKGSVQNIIDLEDGSGLKLTVARYFTPAHRSIHGVGIAPDLEVPDPRQLVMSMEDARNAVKPELAALVSPPPGMSLPKDDWPLTAACNRLRQSVK